MISPDQLSNTIFEVLTGSKNESQRIVNNGYYERFLGNLRFPKKLDIWRSYINFEIEDLNTYNDILQYAEAKLCHTQEDKKEYSLIEAVSKQN